jgi:hypothetical protein
MNDVAGVIGEIALAGIAFSVFGVWHGLARVIRAFRRPKR